MYLDKKYDMQATIAINGALSQIRRIEWAIDFEDDVKHETRKDRLRENLQKAKKDLEHYEKQYQTILEKAADAMNLLSSKYNVNIDV